MPGRGRGRTKTPTPEPGDLDDEGQGNVEVEHGAVGGELDNEGAEPTLLDLANLLRAHIGQQQATEAHWTRELLGKIRNLMNCRKS